MTRASFASRGLRVAGPIALFLFLGGPSPGSVGSCGGDDFQDYPEFCVVFNSLVCQRLIQSGAPACNTGGVDPGERCYDAELCTEASIQRDCAAATWSSYTNFMRPCNPPPTVAEVNACIQTLLVTDNRVPEGQIPQCASTTLCP